MGLFDRLLKKDPAAELAKAEELLRRGEAARALVIARRVANGSDVTAVAAARDLVVRARETLIENALAQARESEASDYLEDAVEWLRTASEAAADDSSRRAPIERRIAELESRIAAEEDASAADVWPEAESAAADDGYRLDSELAWDSLVAMLRDDVAARYQGRPAAFRTACVDLNEGRFDDARRALEELGLDDPVVCLERGRCRLAGDDPVGAQRDFEAVWEVFGDQPLDRGGALSLPALWADAALAHGDAKAVVERLERLADPAAGRPELAERYAEALLASGALEPAKDFLIRAATFFAGMPSFPYLLARVLVRLGERDAAIDCLETAIAPSCAGGSCGKTAKHLPSLRRLTTLYLERGEPRDQERAHQLMLHAFEAQSGRLGADDYALRARYHELRGEAAAAADARAKAERLARAPAAAEAVTGSLRDQEAVL